MILCFSKKLAFFISSLFIVPCICKQHCCNVLVKIQLGQLLEMDKHTRSNVESSREGLYMTSNKPSPQLLFLSLSHTL